MPVAADLQINRSYLDTNFEGYKLNTSSLPIYIKSIPEGIDIVHPSDDQYSFIQQREFSIHNHLHSDPWDPLSVYYVDAEWKIKRLIVLSKEDDVEGPHEVWEVPKRKQRVTGQSNVTVCFATQDMATVSDGAGTMYILSTGCRQMGSPCWKPLHSEELDRPSRIVDVRSPAQGEVHLLFIFVDSKQTYLNHMHLASSEGGHWKLERYHSVFGKGALDYAALELDCLSIYVVSQEELKSQDHVVNQEELKSQDHDNRMKLSAEKEASFEWQQNYEELKVWLNVDSLAQPTVRVSTAELSIGIPGKTLLEGKLYRAVEDGLTVWNLANSKLEVVMSKRDEGSMWPKIFEVSDFQGKEVIDPELVADIHSKLAHLTSETEDVGGATVLNSGQLEECDINDGERRAFFVYNISSAVVSSNQKTELGSGQWLMEGPRTEKRPPQFCIRSDVDGIICDVTQEQKLVHSATFCAFGFIQASKASRIYSFFPSDLSYAGVVDADGRVFLYSGGLRPGHRTSWGTQYVLSLASEERILGIHATPHHIFLLSSHQLHVIRLIFR